MSRIGAWLRGSARSSSIAHAQPFNAVDEAKNLEDALSAASLVMNDDIEGAEKALRAGSSSFHQLGRGVTIFMQALLGFEVDVMKAASERLAGAEASAWADMKRAQKDDSGFHSNIYPLGTEYALVYAQSQLMLAVVAVLQESLAAAVQGFFKLRKAFMTLDGIMEAEHKYMKQKDGLDGSSETSLSSQPGEEHMPGGFNDDSFMDAASAPIVRSGSSTKITGKITNRQVVASGPPGTLQDEDSDLEFVDADEAHSGMQTPANYLGHVTSNEAVEEQLKDLSSGNYNTGSSEPDASKDPVTPVRRRVLNYAADSDIFSNPIDVFVHSGSNLCFGLILLILSMVPPAFGKLLSIIGFKGDRDRGIRMLWTVTLFPNINAAVAGLVLLGYYNGLLGFSDIVLTETDASSDNVTGYPKTKCEALLADMRTRYPQSRMWRLEEARMKSGKRDLKGAIEILTHNEDSPMKQIAALNMFEKALNVMSIHDYRVCEQSFMKCVELNAWSPCLYHFIAGCAQVELYRDVRECDPVAAKAHKDKALELLMKAPTFAGKKRFMAKQLPFDVFVVRKIQKWEERAKDWAVDFIDVIGVSPLEEMIYLWNGTKRMSAAELEKSSTNLEWHRTSHPDKHEMNLDEVAVHSLLRASILRNMGCYEDAREILKDKILQHDRAEFKGPLCEDWSCPSAHYEMAVISWFEKDIEGVDEKAKVAECEKWLRQAERWESYVMDTRIGLKITTAIDTLKMYKLGKGP